MVVIHTLASVNRVLHVIADTCRFILRIYCVTLIFVVSLMTIIVWSHCLKCHYYVNIFVGSCHGVIIWHDMTSSRWSGFVGNFPSQLTQNMQSSRYDRMLTRASVAISHLKHAMEHFCIQSYAEHAILLSICQLTQKMATTPCLLASPV